MYKYYLIWVIKKTIIIIEHMMVFLLLKNITYCIIGTLYFSKLFYLWICLNRIVTYNIKKKIVIFILLYIIYLYLFLNIIQIIVITMNLYTYMFYYNCFLHLKYKTQ